MAATVFFSWQSDIPTDVGRNFVRRALEDACASITGDGSVDEAHRDLEVDSDTQGVAGQPPIVETIFKKIDAAKVFVADMTLVAARAGGGASPNPNVLIEYGWALKSLTHERIICVMNTAYGKPSRDTLPFDLQHLRWPLSYELPKNATAEVRGEQKRALTGRLAEYVRACLATLAPPEPKRIPLSELREWAIAAGWCGDIQSATVGDNDWRTFAIRLRQAAADGAIEFWGRRYVADFGWDLDNEVLVGIPKEHFAAFEFDLIALAQASNYGLFTAKLGESRNTLKGQIFRDLHVNADQARRWLGEAGRPPPSAEVAVAVRTPGAKIGDYQPVCCLVVTNTGQQEFDRCLVQMTELSRALPAQMPMPVTLRSDSQIRNNERGPFSIFAKQQAIVPIAFRSPQRANEWFLFDENGQRHFIPADPTKMLVHIYGGAAPGAALVFINTDAGWNAMPSVETVPTDFSLYRPETVSEALPLERRQAPPYEFFGPELARIVRQQIRVLDRVTVNFICSSTKTELPGDTWASLKPVTPALYPNAHQFRELPATDATLLVEFYDSLQGINDTLNSYIDRWPTTEFNCWLGLLHQVRNSLKVGEKAVEVFCPDKPFNEASPAGGTILNQYERATTGAQKALDAHIARNSTHHPVRPTRRR